MVIKSDKIKDPLYLLTQTPQNYPTDKNYYLRELQEKINRDWRFRPNRIDLEEESEAGTETYTVTQAVVQTVKNEKGQEVSDDWKRLVFRELNKKLRIGARFRFASDFDFTADDEDKNIWIAVNQNRVQETASQVVVRCNGSIGSLYTDSDGIVTVHYEPVVQGTDLSGTDFNYSLVAIDPRGKLEILAQYNKYTAQYYINQRFVIGTDTVFKVQNIQKGNSLTTYKPTDIGIIKLYLEMDDVGDQDDLTNRLAYNGRNSKAIDVPSTPTTSNYEIKIESPVPVPLNLYSSNTTMVIALYNNGTKTSDAVSIEYSITGVTDITKYINYFNPETNTFVFSRKRFLGGGELNIKFSFTPSGSTETIYKELTMSLGGIE